MMRHVSCARQTPGYECAENEVVVPADLAGSLDLWSSLEKARDVTCRAHHFFVILRSLGLLVLLVPASRLIVCLLSAFLAVLLPDP